MDYDHLRKKLDEAKAFSIPDPEKTFFSIGGRGYFENPVSDVLAFFLNPQEAHGFGTLFLDCFFNSLEPEICPESVELVNPPEREVSTEFNKRIDLLLEGDDWVLVIENKIYHHQSNPVTHYEDFVENKYPKKRPIYVVLSPNGSSDFDNWKALSYQKFIGVLKENLGNAVIDNQYSKWVIFLRDFILNLEQYAVRSSMDRKAIEFIESDYLGVYEIIKLQKSYVNYLQKEGMFILQGLFPDQDFTTTVHNWGHGPAIIYYSPAWVGKSHFVIHLSHDKYNPGLGIYMYVYRVPKESVAEVDRKLEMANFSKRTKTQSKAIRCYLPNTRYNSFQEMLPEFNEAAKKFDSLNKQRKSKVY